MWWGNVYRGRIIHLFGIKVGKHECLVNASYKIKASEIAKSSVSPRTEI